MLSCYDHVFSGQLLSVLLLSCPFTLSANRLLPPAALGKKVPESLDHIQPQRKDITLYYIVPHSQPFMSAGKGHDVLRASNGHGFRVLHWEWTSSERERDCRASGRGQGCCSQPSPLCLFSVASHTNCICHFVEASSFNRLAGWSPHAVWWNIGRSEGMSWQC